MLWVVISEFVLSELDATFSASAEEAGSSESKSVFTKAKFPKLELIVVVAVLYWFESS